MVTYTCVGPRKTSILLSFMHAYPEVVRISSEYDRGVSLPCSLSDTDARSGK